MASRVIVVGLDGSDTSMRAAAYALGQAQRQGARLVGVHVRQLAGGAMSFADPFGAAISAAFASQNELENEFRDTLQRERARLDVDLEIVVRHGDPYTELCQAAAEVWADAVIVGRSEGTLHRFAGSVAQRLVRTGRWPVTVVP